jgi:RND family efflux transporter MFP subunit
MRGVRVLLSLIASAYVGCSQSAATVEKPQPPAKVAKVAHEEELNTLVLTPEAERRLDITTVAVESRKIDRFRTYGGEITLPTGASIVVSAPVGGTLEAPAQAGVPKPGEPVQENQTIFLLMPLLSPERAVLTPAERIRFAEAKNAVAASQIEAQGQVDQAQVQVSAAQIALERAEKLLREQSGTVRAVDEARAQLDLTQKALDAAQARKRLVDNIKLDEEPGSVSPLVIRTPRAGVIRAQHAAVGEVVGPGALLFEVMDYDPIWIRVPVYVGEAGEIDRQQPARVSNITDHTGASAVPAEPVSAPPTAAVLASTVDLYYQVENSAVTFRPGERVSVKLSLAGTQQSLGIPWSAVLHDIHGGAWVYEQTEPHTYVRRRVEVRHVVDDWAALSKGPPEGVKIVTQGALELFGTEFGFAK